MVLQNSVSPAPEYIGCTDTWISDEPWETDGDFGRSQTLRCGGKRHILIRFDLLPLPEGDVIHRAVLRLADIGYPRREGGKFSSTFLCYRIIHAWNDNANWLEHTRTNYKEADKGDWQMPGGDVDTDTDFGREKRGVIASDSLADGRWGHMHELDITAMVRRWYGGEVPNNGVLLEGVAGHCEVASSEWYVPRFRPQLLIAHAARGSPPASVEPLSPAPEEVELDPIAATPDRGEAMGDYSTVRVGQNSACLLRGASTDAYTKEAVEKYPGTWGWMTMCRVGGRAGDFSRALLYFDLSEIPENASIKEARLHLSLTPYTNAQASSYRYGAFLLRLPESPGWIALEVTVAQRKSGVPWPEGGLVAASNGKPIAIGKVISVREGDQAIPAAMEFDLTGVVRAWVQRKLPNCGIVLDNRIEGGAYDFYSSRCYAPHRRPYLEITLSPSIAAVPKRERIVVGLPEGDYWVEPMREVHKRFKGKHGTLAQYGDSITVTMAFLASYSYGDEIAPKNCPPEVKKELDAVASYANRALWREWKGPEWGNTGMMKSDWLIENVDAWQKKMNPEVAVILFGTNDLGSICPPEYTENMAAAIRRMLADGTVPMLTTVPPCANRDPDMMRDYWLALLSIAGALKIPVIDYYSEIIRRRPADWNGALEKFNQHDGYDVPTLISRDGVHPSHPAKYRNDFSEEALNCNGYGLRDYLTLRKYYEVITKVLKTGG